jgi:hypothetical protein
MNAGGLHAERIENLAVDGGEGRDAARVKIDDAEQRAAMVGSAGVGDRPREEA